MGIEQDSLDHLHKHMDEGFSEIMENYVVDYVEWIEVKEDELVAYAPMLHTNVIALFPPFIPNDTNNNNNK